MSVSLAEKNALIDIYNSTQGGSWKNNFGWGSSLNVCDWYGVTCECELTQDDCETTDTNVIRLLLTDNNLNGVFPNAVADLGSLETLNLSHNSLEGSLPDAISDLFFLENLYLGFNRFSGHVPAPIIKLVNLEEVNLHFNALYSNDSVVEAFINQRLTDDPLFSGFEAYQALDISDLAQVEGVSYVDFVSNVVGVELTGSNFGIGEVVILVSDDSGANYAESEYRVENGNYVVENLSPNTHYLMKAVSRVGEEGVVSDGANSNTIEIVSPSIEQDVSGNLVNSNSSGGGSSGGLIQTEVLFAILGLLIFKKISSK